MESIQPVILVAGPSGAGKTASVARIVSLRPNIKRVITSTTRAPRFGEQDGVDYHFLASEKFEDLVQDGRFVENDGPRNPDGTYIRRYGVQWKALTDIWFEKRVPIAAITLPGVQVVHEKYPHALRIFLRPTEATELEGRIRKRDPEIPKKEVEERIQLAHRELEFAHRTCDNILIAGDGMLESVIKRMLYLIDGYLADSIFKV